MVKGKHTGARLALYLTEGLDCIELTNGGLLGIKTDNASSNGSITQELQSTLEPSAIGWPAIRNHMPCIVHFIQVALDVFISSLGVKGHNKSWESHECDQQIGENESTDIGKSQRGRKGINAKINKVLAMRPGLAKIIEKVCISRCYERTETGLYIAENICWI